MGRLGRNEPCPCGSGKKYKRCCLARDERKGTRPASAPTPKVRAAPKARAAPKVHAAPKSTSSAPLNPPRAPEGTFSGTLVPDMRPYVIARMVEDSPEWEDIRKRDPKQWAMRTVAGVARLSTEEIQKRLIALGIDASREGFLASAAGETSAWDVSVKWLEGQPKSSLPRFAEDFAGLAACRLWQEFLPDRPSLEMVDDWIREGYDEETRRPERVCDIWWKVWEFLRPRLTPAMRRREDVDAMCLGMQSILNWTQDFALALYNESNRDGAWTERGIGYLRELLDRFPDDDWLTATNTRCDLGELQFIAGRATEGEDTLRAVIHEYPDRAIGYCRLSDAFSMTDKRQALALLEEARDRPVSDARKFFLEGRIEDLQKDLRKERDA